MSEVVINGKHYIGRPVMNQTQLHINSLDSCFRKDAFHLAFCSFVFSECIKLVYKLLPVQPHVSRPKLFH